MRRNTRAADVPAVPLDYLAIFDAVRQPYLILTPQFVIIDANPAYLRATMTARDAVRGRHLFDVFPDNPSDPAADGVHNLRASLRNVLEERLPHAMPIQKYDIRRPDGEFEERFWDPLNTPVLTSDDRISLIVHHVKDVT